MANQLDMDPNDIEAERFHLIAEYLDKIRQNVDHFSNNELKEDSLSHLTNLENLILQNPDWVYNQGLPGVKMGIFGSFKSGWEEILKIFLGHHDNIYDENMGIRVKHVINLSDLKKQLLLIRRESELMPEPEICNWIDFGLFPFRLNDEDSFKQAILSHKKLVSWRVANEKFAPTILVGCSKGSDKFRLKSFVELKKISNQFGFHDYFEVRIDNGWNMFFLFEYCTLLSLRAKQPDFVPPVMVKTESDSISEVSDSKRMKFNNRKIDLNENSEHFRFPLDSHNKKSTKRYSLMNQKLNKTTAQKQLSGDISDSCSVSSLKNQNSLNIMEPIENIVTQGILFKGRNKKFVTITKDGKMFYHNSKEDYDKNVIPKHIDLKLCSVKIPGNSLVNGYVSSSENDRKRKINDEKQTQLTITFGKSQVKTQIYRALSEKDRDDWFNNIRDAIYNRHSAETLEKIPNKITSEDNLDDLLITICEQYGNDICAECGAQAPDWLVFNIGILVCARCSGGHRSLGVEYSKVCSLKLDKMEKIKIKVLEYFGNVIVNSVMEAKLHLTDDIKPTPETSDSDLQKWLTNKYKLKKYLSPLPLATDEIQKQFIFSVKENDNRCQLMCLMHATKEDLNAPYDPRDQRTALLIAVQLRRIVTIQLLLWMEVNVTVQDEDGLNAFGYASLRPNGEPVSDEMKEIQEMLKRYNTPIQILRRKSSFERQIINK